MDKFVICDNCVYNDETCSKCDECNSGSNFVDKQNCSFEQCDCCKKDTSECEKQVPAATHEPKPIGSGDKVLPEFVKDVYARADSGHKKYGTYLRVNNGRNALLDAYQEAIDLSFYIKQALMEYEKKDSELDWEDIIRQWANDRHLYENTTPFAQMTKLLEESLEWHTEVQRGDVEAEKLELGDMFVVLTNIANSRGFSLRECGWLAYQKIKDRTGHIVGGSFVKDDPDDK